MASIPYTHPLTVARLNPRQPTPLALVPDETARARIAAELGLSALPKAQLDGAVRAVGSDAWELSGRLTARVVQPCVVTLAPVITTIDEPVHRTYSPHASAPDGEEVEMTDDETEPLGQIIDAGAVLVEALALALPLYPRAPGAQLPEDTGDEDAEATRRPFADLAALMQRKDD